MATETELPGFYELAKMFEYLDDLRESGATNMYGARPYLFREFAGHFDDEAHAGVVLSAWMKTFDGETDAEERANAAIDKAAP